jgi:hypothetical protein
MAIPLSCLAVGLGFATRNSARRRKAETPASATPLAVIAPAGTDSTAARPADGDR